MNQFMGISPVFWYGVVEDRIDPLKLGRVRVRIAGLHSEKLVEDNQTGEGIPVESLPWAHPGMPITSASMNGIGDTPIGPVEGTWVCGMARDGRPCQNLIYLWTLPGIPAKAPIDEGFNDTEATLPVNDRPAPFGETGEKFPRSKFIGESDTNRLARNENIDQTIVKKKRDLDDTNVRNADGSTWNEKTTPYAAKYPFNRVSETESGHIVERDDTKGAERTHDYHRSGTFDEVHPNGSKVTRVIKDNYEIIHGDDYVHVKGNVNIRIEGNANISVKGNVVEEVEGSVNKTITKDYTINAAGNITLVGNQIHLNP